MDESEIKQPKNNDIFSRRDYDADKGDKALQRLADQVDFLMARMQNKDITVKEEEEDGEEQPENV